jgi:hypothetical protein
MDKITLKLQERLVQTCIDFINEHKDDEQVKEIQIVEFTVDGLQFSAEEGSWQPDTDSSCILQGRHILENGLGSCYLIDKSY